MGVSARLHVPSLAPLVFVEQTRCMMTCVSDARVARKGTHFGREMKREAQIRVVSSARSVAFRSGMQLAAFTSPATNFGAGREAKGYSHFTDAEN